jgi:Asp-tRNA(Asn)/Glu-tRNA(Gln) amidotransferase A subunit family amidase
MTTTPVRWRSGPAPDRDAFIERLRAAGTVLLGKTT